MHVAFLLILLSLCLPSARGQGAAYPPAPRLNAEQLIAYYQEGPSRGDMADPAFLLGQRYAKGYLAGVADAAQGRLWCDTGSVKTVELDGIVIAGLKTLSEQQRQGDAARLALAILARHFPCTTPPTPGG